MRNQRPVMVDIDDADATDAINAFLHVLNRQRALGLMPRTEHTLAEHLFRGDAKVIFYSSSGGIISLVQDEESINDEDAFDMVMFIMERRKQRARERREAAITSAIDARSDETLQAAQPERQEPGPEGETPNPTQGNNQ
jgi:hypothetical protein